MIVGAQSDFQISPSVDLSVVIPIYNERGNLQPLVEELLDVLLTIAKAVEIILVDDGSVDGSFDVMKEIKRDEDQLILVRLERHRGQSDALAAGFELASGSVIVTMDGDCQNDPRDIPVLLESLRTFDMVCGMRTKRAHWHSFTRYASARIAAVVRMFALRDGIRDSTAPLKVFKSSTIRDIPYFKGFHRFLPNIASMNGLRVLELPINHRPRKHGKSKYGIRNRIFKTSLDMLGVLWLFKRRIDFQIKEIIR
jgi:glycosyltransferase involved in cell wall biosynthesis